MVIENVMLTAINVWTLIDAKLEQQHALCILPSREIVQVRSDVNC
jgi:hypothetical protein